MSRSGYSDDLEQSELAMWRGRVASAIRGKRGQALLKELEAALVALPEKKLIRDAIAADGQVCALGAVALRRKLAAGIPHDTAVAAIKEEWPCNMEDYAATQFNIAECLAQEIMYINDNDYASETPEQRYENVLKWVRNQIKSQTKHSEKK